MTGDLMREGTDGGHRQRERGGCRWRKVWRVQWMNDEMMELIE
jgi:hypothetical protein